VTSRPLPPVPPSQDVAPVTVTVAGPSSPPAPERLSVGTVTSWVKMAQPLTVTAPRLRSGPVKVTLLPTRVAPVTFTVPPTVTFPRTPNRPAPASRDVGPSVPPSKVMVAPAATVKVPVLVPTSQSHRGPDSTSTAPLLFNWGSTVSSAGPVLRS